MKDIELWQGDCLELDEGYFNIAKKRIEEAYSIVGGAGKL